MQRKMNITTEELWEGLPSGIKDIADYLHNINLYDEIDYEFIRLRLFDIANSEGIKIPEDTSQFEFNWKFKEGWKELHHVKNKKLRQGKAKLMSKGKINSSDPRLTQHFVFKSPQPLKSK